MPLSTSGFMLLLLFGSVMLLSSIVHVNAEPKVVSMTTKRILRSALEKRDTEVVGLDNFIMLYTINTTIGTPSQPITLHIDTGSADTWVFSAELKTADDTDSIFFDSNASRTYVPQANNFQTGYVDGSHIKGEYFIDNFTVGDISVQQVMMAKAYEVNRSSSAPGIFGLGPAAMQAKAVFDKAQPYKSIIESMKDQGQIKSVSFSMWLNSLQSEEGNLLFGGYDTEKFFDELNMVPMLSQLGYQIALTGLAFEAEGQQTYLPLAQQQPILLDSGSSLTSLPSQLFDWLADIFNCTMYTSPEGETGFVVPCAMEDAALNLLFQFGGTNAPFIVVPASEFILPLGNSSLSYEVDGSPACQFGLQPNNRTKELSILGDTFLRSAYIFHDLENMQIGIANAKWNVTESNIIKVSGNGGVASATTFSGATITQGAEYTPVVIGIEVITGNATNITKPTGSTTSLEGGFATTIHQTISRGGVSDDASSSTASETSSASATSTTSAASKRSTLPLSSLALCGLVTLMFTLVI